MHDPERPLSIDPTPSKSYKSYLLYVLMALLTFNFADRLALGVVLQDIKVDLHLTDTQLGLLSGIAFALFYAVMGFPIARWADRGHRVNIIALTAALWSVMVALCGAATGFVQLMLIRIGVGIGEAGCMPPANSLIGDYFTREERPRATALYMQGLNVSPILAYFVAGWLNQFYGWRTMFVLIGLPGLLLAVLAFFTLREPRANRATHATDGITSAAEPGLKNSLLALWSNATFRHLLYAFSVFYFFAYGITQWQPAFLERSFHVATGALGTWLALVYGLGGLVGTYAGGAWASRYAGANEQLQLRVMALMNAGFNSLLWALIYFSHSAHVAFFWMALSTLGGTSILGPMYAIAQTLVPPRMRAMSMAIILLFANLVGMGLGPLVAGAISDVLQPHFGSESLRFALLALSPGYLWSSWHLWRASVTVKDDLMSLNALEERGLGTEQRDSSDKSGVSWAQ